ncbi:MAG: helix-turn-helix transcriptional regulator [Methanosarcina sp.]
MNKKELAHAIILAASLFSLSLLLFSQGTTSLSVSLSDEQPFAVDVPTMFTMNKVIIMLVLASIGTYSLTMLTTIIGMVQKITTPVTEENVIGSQSLPYREEDYTSKMNNNRNDIVPDISPDTALVDIEITEESESNIDKAGPLPFNKAEHKRKIASDILEGDEKKIYLIVYEKKQILQSELVLESGLSKVKVSRLLQKLENKSLLLRKPYGNTNKVIIAE